MIIKIDDKVFNDLKEEDRNKIIADILQGNLNVSGMEIYVEPEENKELNIEYKFLKPEFRKELRELISKHSLEQDSQTPDWCIANYLINCLLSMNTVINGRDIWYEDDKKLTVTKYE